jgi:hypothetical protein
VITVYVSIGNSDDKLTQSQWAIFRSAVNVLIRMHASQIHGAWASISHDAWQNACWAFDVDPAITEYMKGELARLAAQFDQDSIAWAVAETEFIAGASNA